MINNINKTSNHKVRIFTKNFIIVKDSNGEFKAIVNKSNDYYVLIVAPENNYVTRVNIYDDGANNGEYR